MIIVFVGPPGSGKGTQSDMVKDILDVDHIATGDILRDEIQRKTPLGVKIKDIIERGDLLDNNDILSALETRITNIPDEKIVILDGFPRTIEQAKLLQEKYTGPLKVLHFHIDETRLRERLLSRYSCANCSAVYNEKTNPTKEKNKCDACGSAEFIVRKDDTEEVFEQRMKNYKEKTQPLIDFYSRNGVLYSIDADKNKDEIHKEVMRFIKENVKKGIKA
ncbi:MAG: nucleoside monophosphate kinase [Alphaproteobacteria bacterium]|nr:MAG: nucleoside monophosphate kinase [Alphaproteobacteria bacterium]